MVYNPFKEHPDNRAYLKRQKNGNIEVVYLVSPHSSSKERQKKN